MRLFSAFADNLRHAVRGFRREPAFTATVLTTFALCLGANVVIFSVVHSVLLAPLPFPHPEQLVTMFNSYPKAGVERSMNSVPNYFERREGGVPAFAEVCAYRLGSTIVTDGESPRRELSINVTPSFCRVLRMSAARGRLLSDEEADYGKNTVVVVSDDYWRGELHADPAAVGKTLTLDGEVTTIIGVLPPHFGFLSWSPPLWRPLAFADWERDPRRRDYNTISIIARLRPDVTIIAAQAQLDALNERRLASDPDAAWAIGAGLRTTVASLHDDHVAGARPALLRLQAGALLLLLIGGVNVVNLLLIRASSHAKEWAVRQVLGAGRLRIVAGIGFDLLLLAVAGGGLGLAVGAATLRLLSVVGAEQLPLSRTISLDGTVAMTALLAAVVTGLLLALPVVAFSMRGDPARSLSVESRSGTTTRATHRWRQTLVVAQVALACVLLICAGLLCRSFQRLLAVDPGFRPEDLVIASVMLPGKSYADDASRQSFAERWLEALRGISAVKSSGIGTSLPVVGEIGSSAIWVEGHAPRAGESERPHYVSAIGGNYLAALGVPLREGRYLDASDMRRPNPVCVVDEDFSRRYWPGGGALGRLIAIGNKDPGSKAMTIVGVVGSVKQTGLNDTRAYGMVYTSITKESTPGWMIVVVRTEQPTTTIVPAMRVALQQIDPSLPLDDPRPMIAHVSDSMKLQRSSLVLAAIFSSIALLLTAVGIYGVLAFVVAQRRREIGIRLALGALPAQVRRLFLALGIRVLVCGLSAGVLAAWLAGRAMRSQLFGVSAFDPLVFACAATVLGSVVLAASLLPSHRAAQISPSEALRHE